VCKLRKKDFKLDNLVYSETEALYAMELTFLKQTYRNRSATILLTYSLTFSALLTGYITDVDKTSHWMFHTKMLSNINLAYFFSNIVATLGSHNNTACVATSLKSPNFQPALGPTPYVNETGPDAEKPPP
jgi:hypothetical protein